MRALRYAVLAFLLASMLLIAQPAQAWHNGFGGIDADYPTGTNLVSSDGLVLSYNMEDLTRDGEMADLSGEGNHGTITGTNDTQGVFGRAREFDGTDDRITAQGDSSLDITGALTLVWRGTIDSTSNGGGMMEYRLANVVSPYVLYYSPTQVAFNYYNGTEWYTWNTGTLRVDTPVVYIVTRNDDGTVIRGWEDGVEIGGAPVGKGPGVPSTSPGLSIGYAQYTQGGNLYHKGIDDELLIFSRALTDAEIRYLSTPDIHEFGVPATSIPLTTAIGIHGLSTTVTLQADSDCATCNYRWDTGDGHVRDGPTVTHSYDVRGLWAVYYPTLEVCNFSGTVCEERSFRIVLVNWPAAAVMGFLFGGVLIAIGKRQRWYRVVKMR